MLYIRMALTMLVSLYTSRVVLNALGTTDYGIFNVVGGVVAMLGFFNSSISTSTQRFLNVGMASNEGNNLIRIFSSAINVHIIIAIITVILLETIGLWFLKNKLVIPFGLESTALWVFQCSVITFFISIISAPYNAAIIAYERMSAFAVLSIIDCILKLGVAISIIYYGTNKLRLYATLMMLTAIIMRIAYGLYCRRKLKDISYKYIWDLPLIKKMMSFSGWLIFGCIADLFGTQGVNMLINIYFGPILNTARAIGVQVQGAVSQFYTSFSISVNPQITKSYAEKDYDYSYNLVFGSSKIIFFLMLIITIPIILRSEQILTLWLKNYPPITPIIVNLILIDALIRSLYSPISQTCFASGKLKAYQLSIGILFLLIFFSTYILFDYGASVLSAFIISIIVSFIGLIIRLFIINRINRFPVRRYFTDIILRLSSIGISSFILCHIITNNFPLNIAGLLYETLTSIVLTTILIAILGFNSKEKEYAKGRILFLLNRNK